MTVLEALTLKKQYSCTHFIFSESCVLLCESIAINVKATASTYDHMNNVFSFLM